MIYSRSYHLIFIAASLIQTCFGLTCYKCLEANNCGDANSDTCTGDFCFSSRFAHPTHGESMMLSAKGCVRSDLEPELAMNTCISYIVPRTSGHTSDGEGTERQVCFCNGTRLCNADATHTLTKHTARYQTCSCAGYPYCSASDQCTGQMCTYTTQTTQGTRMVKQGCVNSTGPSIENSLNSGCITPGLIGQQGGQVDFDPFLDAETCICDKGFCNRVNPQRRPATPGAPKSRCNMKISMNILGAVSRESSERSCEGDFCFEMTMDMNQLVKFRYQGCMSVPEQTSKSDKEAAKKIKPGCAEIDMPMTIAKVCITKNVV